MTGCEQPAASAAHPLSEDREAGLWRDWRERGSMRAREQLFALHAAFARQVARRHYLDGPGGDIEFQDLHQLACAGLLEAIDRYDPTHGVPFRGYAARRISGSVLDGIARTSEVREQISYRSRVRRERMRSIAAAPVPAAAPVADALGALVEAAVGLALGFMLEGTSLYRREGEAAQLPNAYESLAWKNMVARMMRELSGLPQREQAILRHHYLDGMAFDQIAGLLGLTKGRISQLHKTAIALLGKRLARAGDYTL
jgi:RNA polymerase sigma factor for flagellar operon FliA